MTHFLATDDNPKGYKLEDILALIRNDLIRRSEKIADDRRHEAQSVLEHNIRILGLLTEAIDLARQSTGLLDRHFGPSDGVHPRIGSG